MSLHIGHPRVRRTGPTHSMRLEVLEGERPDPGRRLHIGGERAAVAWSLFHRRGTLLGREPGEPLAFHHLVTVRQVEEGRALPWK